MRKMARVDFTISAFLTIRGMFMKTKMIKTSPLLLSAAMIALLAACGTSPKPACLPGNPYSPECEAGKNEGGEISFNDKTPEPAPEPKQPDAPKPDNKPEPKQPDTSPAPSEKKAAVDDGFKFDGGSRFTETDAAPTP